MKNIKNRKAYFEYSILEEYDGGLCLEGSEVKSIRNGDVTITDSFLFVKSGEIFVKNMKIARYKNSHKLINHEENRDKKVLLTRKEIIKIERMLEEKGTTMVCLGLFLKNNRIKIKLGVCKGKKLHDKRNTIKERDLQRELKDVR